MGQHKRESRFACITYHGVGNEPDQYTVSETDLREQLSYLRDEGFTVEDFPALEKRLLSRTSLPSRYVVATVDDGLWSCCIAAELFQRFGFLATFFVTRDRCLTKPGYIRENQIRQLRSSGISFGTHGTSHQKLTRMSLESCGEELAGSKRWLEDVLGEPVRHMAAPGGYINSAIAKMSFECGYTLVGSCREWLNDAKTLRPPALVNRVNVRRHFREKTFRQLLAGDLEFYLRRQLRSAALWLPKQLLSA